MNLATHAAVLWRYRAVTAAGVLLGIVLAVLAAYQVSWDGGPSLKPRGTETWKSESSLLVTQAGFPEGRVTLPAAPPAQGTLPGSTPVEPEPPKDRIEFADPLRFSFLAQLYAQLAVSDRVIDQLPGDPDPEQIEAVPVEGAAATQLPVIQLITTAGSAAAAKALNANLVKSLQSFLESDQAAANIRAQERTRIELLSAPAPPVMTAGRSHTASILAFLLCVLGAVAVAHLLAALRFRKESGWGDTGNALSADDFAWDDGDGANAIIVPWSAAERNGDPLTPQPASVAGGDRESADAEPAEPRRSSGRRPVR